MQILININDIMTTSVIRGKDKMYKYQPCYIHPPLLKCCPNIHTKYLHLLKLKFETISKQSQKHHKYFINLATLLIWAQINVPSCKDYYRILYL